MNIPSNQALRIFISYNSKDVDFSVELMHDLRQILGDDAVWHNIPDDFQDDAAGWSKIMEGLITCSIFIIVLSPYAMESKRMRREFTIALNQSKLIVPVLYRKCEVWTDLKIIQNISFLPSTTYKLAFNNLLLALGLQTSVETDRRKTTDLEETGLISELPVGIPGHRTLSGERPQPKLRISRRKAVLGLVGVTGLAIGGTGITWWIHNQTPQVQKTIQKPRLGTTLVTYRGHSDQVLDVSWSPDGKRLASVSADKTVQVWDAFTGGHILTYRGHSAIVRRSVWSPDGLRIASASDDKTIQVWNAATGHLIFTYHGHSSSVDTAAWSPNGRYIASASTDGIVRVWDANTGSLVYFHPRDPYTLIVWTLAWSPDSRRIVTAGYQTLQAWDATNGNNLIIYSNTPKGTFDVAWSPDGTRIASTGYLGTSVQIWDANNGGSIYNYHRHTDTVFAVAWSPHSTQIASGSWDKTVQIWDPNTGNRIYSYHGHSVGVYAVPWSPDGTRIASASADKTVQVWQAVLGT